MKIKSGTHTYEFGIDDRFFTFFEDSTIKHGKLDVTATLEKNGNTFTVNIEGRGTVGVQCDRCLKDINYPVDARLTMLVKLVEEPREDEDEIVYVSLHSGVLNIAQHIYDMIYLSLPLRKVCADAKPPQKCDEAMVNKITQTDDEEAGPAPSDPRWDKLKDLL